MADKEGNEHFKIYSDGSAQEGKVGAAAVLICPGKAPHKLHFHLRTTEQHTIFEAELVGLLMGLHLIKTEKKQTSFALGADNLAALTAAATPSNKSGHYLADTFLTTAFKLRKTYRTANYALTLRWTAGHVNIEGNELADKEAKLAAEGIMLDTNALPKILKKPLKYSKSAVNQAKKKKIKVTWTCRWNKSPHAQKTKHINPSLPSPKFLKLISNLDISRKGASWLFQLQSGHFPLNAYLHRFKRAASTSCPACGYHSKLLQHFLLNCPIYAHERWPLLTANNSRNRDFAILVGKTLNVIPIIDFIQATGRLTQDFTTRGNGPGEKGGRNTEAEGTGREGQK
jgi:ribonuclease HI